VVIDYSLALSQVKNDIKIAAASGDNPPDSLNAPQRCKISAHRISNDSLPVR
jgi:hypothetical protein